LVLDYNLKTITGRSALLYSIKLLISSKDYTRKKLDFKHENSPILNAEIVVYGIILKMHL